MSEPYIGEIRMFGFNFPPRGWAVCSGQLLAISQNSALFSLLGTTYGGNGVTTFALPDLRGRAPIHVGQGTGLSPRAQGEAGGAESRGLTVGQMPTHTHAVRASGAPSLGTPATGAVLGAPSTSQLFRSGTAANVPMAQVAESAGSSQPHPNMQPFTVVNFSIAMEGWFPSRN